MWELLKEEGEVRTYNNQATGSKCETKKVYTDEDGNDWYLFQDLMMLPHTRQMATLKISSLYALGLSKDDLNNHINGLKTILKSNDKEKYEKAYANVLDFESKASNATDAVKQLSSLTCVYFLLNGEEIDSFDNNLQTKKMAILTANPEMHAFFLNMQIAAIELCQQRSNLISQIVFPKTQEQSEALV